MTSVKPKDVESFIAQAVDKSRPVLKELRSLIKSTFPEVEEKIWYNVPFYHYHGELVGLSVSKNHVTVGYGAGVIEDKDLKALEEKGYKFGKGTMQIKFGQKVPTTAIKKLLKTKAKLNRAKAKQ